MFVFNVRNFINLIELWRVTRRQIGNFSCMYRRQIIYVYKCVAVAELPWEGNPDISVSSEKLSLCINSRKASVIYVYILISTYLFICVYVCVYPTIHIVHDGNWRRHHQVTVKHILLLYTKHWPRSNILSDVGIIYFLARACDKSNAKSHLCHSQWHYIIALK